jgi:hypothetical protein
MSVEEVLGAYIHYKGGFYMLLAIAETHHHDATMDAVYYSVTHKELRTRPYRRDRREEDSWCDLVRWPDGFTRQRFLPLHCFTHEELERLTRIWRGGSRSAMMKRVVIESPYASTEPGGVERNRRYLNACILDCIARGESPYASHKMLTDSLDDTDPHERALGIQAGFAWRAAADKTVVYDDFGISTGMLFGIDDAQKSGRPVEYRKLGPNWGAQDKPRAFFRALRAHYLSREEAARVYAVDAATSNGAECDPADCDSE